LLPDTDPLDREVDVLRRAVRLVADRLPRDWSIDLRERDGIATLKPPDHPGTILMVEAKRSVATDQLPAIIDRLRRAAADIDGGGTAVVPMVVARYLGSGSREWLERHNVSYADATGNINLKIDRPAVFLRDRGADKDPWRGPGRPLGSLTGPPAARIVRALVDFAPPMTVPTLIKRSGASTGAAYRVAEFLEREALIGREPRGPITTVEWRAILERWSQDYGFQRNNTIGAYLHPRGLTAVFDQLRRSDGLRYAVTGSAAVQRLAPYAATRLATIYVDDMKRAAETLELRRTDAGTNVMLASSDYDVVFERTVTDDGITYVAPSQAAVDLLTGPGRGPAEAQAALDWMESNENGWRQ
jgi:hypothetical protein